jgi:hypothetical protein
MNTRKFAVVLALTTVLGLTVGLAGCPNRPATKGPDGKAGHDHDHDHVHVHKGPHGGSIMEIGEEEFHAEWVRGPGGKITFYFLDAAAKNEAPVEADEIAIEVRIADNEPVTYTLAAVNPEDGRAAVFEITDPNLDGALGALSEKVTATFPRLTLGGKSFENVKIEEHQHGDEH